MRAKAFQIVLGALIGGPIGIASVSSYGWRPTLAAAALLVLAGIAVRALYRASRKTAQIFDDELDKPTDTTGETR